MKYLKLFESYQSESEVDKICEKLGIENWSLERGLVNVDGDVDLYGRKLTELPLKFGTVTGYFDCGWNKLTSLEGCPLRVGSWFYYNGNKLTSLVGCPRSVGSSFHCENNNIREFTGIGYIGGRLYCDGNPIWDIWTFLS